MRVKEYLKQRGLSIKDAKAIFGEIISEYIECCEDMGGDAVVSNNIKQLNSSIVNLMKSKELGKYCLHLRFLCILQSLFYYLCLRIMKLASYNLLEYFDPLILSELLLLLHLSPGILLIDLHQ